MTVLWRSSEPLTPGEVQDQVPSTLAYTSVATVLGRLHTKGLVKRSPSGRAFVYSAVLDEAEFAVRRMNDVVDSVGNRDEVLAGFVSSLSKKEAEQMRKLLGRRQG